MTATDEPHDHLWGFLRTDADWWDGDEEDVYACTVDGCRAEKVEYIPR